jgi:predicted GH43/DUF377 family glycosyl hydrolase
MVKRLSHKVLVTPEDIKPSRPDFKVIGAFNPAAVRFGDEVVLLVRVAERPIEERDEYFPSPHFIPGEGGGITETDWLKIQYNHNGDQREYRNEFGFSRLSFISCFYLVNLDKSGLEITNISSKPVFYPAEQIDEFGVEDPRLSKIDGRYYFTYVAVSREMGIATALAVTDDFVNFERLGIIFCSDNKDVVLLPEKIDGRYAAYHRPSRGFNVASPNMQAAFSPDLIHWGEHKPLLSAREGMWDSIRLGAGPPPIKTVSGWLEVYHGVMRKSIDDPIGVYCAGAALFDLQNPAKLIARTNIPILEPLEEHESQGFVNNVIFPTGIIYDETEENIILYSGGADSVVTATKLSLEEIFDCLSPV